MFEKNDELIKLDINEVNFDNCAEMFNNTNCSIIYITKNVWHCVERRHYKNN